MARGPSIQDSWGLPLTSLLATHRQARVRVCSEFSASAWPVTKAAGPKGEREGWDLALAWGAAQGSPRTKQPGACPVLGGGGKPRVQRWAGNRRILAWALGLHHLPVPIPEVLACTFSPGHLAYTHFLCAQDSPLPKPGGPPASSVYEGGGGRSQSLTWSEGHGGGKCG